MYIFRWKKKGAFGWMKKRRNFAMCDFDHNSILPLLEKLKLKYIEEIYLYSKSYQLGKLYSYEQIEADLLNEIRDVIKHWKYDALH